MSASELKPILLALVQQVDDLRVNQDVLQAQILGAKSLGDLLDARTIAENKTTKQLAELRKWIETL
jgi:hypothetical protein